MRDNLKTLSRGDTRIVERDRKHQRWLDARRKQFEQGRRSNRRARNAKEDILSVVACYTDDLEEEL
jgi:hypothetical protein